MTASEAGREPLLGISQVIAELSEEFPDISQSRIRYYDEQGLVEPRRTPSGYRKFSYGDVERLRFVLRMQKDRYWPLSHIRQVLDQMDSGEVPDTELRATLRVPQVTLAADGSPTAQSITEGAGATRMTRDELVDAAGIDDATLDQIEEFELIRRRPNQRYYDTDDLVVASLVGQLAELGLEPRHLRGFRSAADREVGLLDQVVPPSTRQQAGAAAGLAELAALSVRLHTVLVRAGLRA
ncbi:MerR family transcriptional regulator [Aeromicrobium tamlense]|uniref:DNA-binding transcriptional MerR regulator n=1 Tax=Aeromicrobium tamlense TaxID=375541 RepID=A0A8I0FWQ9_9ACTN|nr:MULTISPECIES: MerR family transcriptional regulator [Aeromicrobium]MBD1270506.1 MerR family transcriptional regulator [Aeromicrobium tamlense]MBD1271362.1 MerR family transcriptional regulator [Aeromicrobium tamlense]NYI37893.1 DNA-binding transcriptional MerR regulator [Aeromicrobium tamlense]